MKLKNISLLASFHQLCTTTIRRTEPVRSDKFRFYKGRKEPETLVNACLKVQLKMKSCPSRLKAKNLCHSVSTSTEGRQIQYSWESARFSQEIFLMSIKNMNHFMLSWAFKIRVNGRSGFERSDMKRFCWRLQWNLCELFRLIPQCFLRKSPYFIISMKSNNKNQAQPQSKLLPWWNSTLKLAQKIV